MTHIGFRLVSITAAWFALCSAAFAADTQSTAAQTADQTTASQATASQPVAGQGPISSSAGAVATASGDDATARQIDAWLADDGAPGSQAAQQGQAQPRAIHGEAGVSFGSRGYRNAYVAADIPVGQNSDLGVAVSDTKIPSYHGYGGGESKSLAVSLSINTAHGGGQTCGPQHWGQTLPTDHLAPRCAEGEGSDLAPGLAAMAAGYAGR